MSKWKRFLKWIAFWWCFAGITAVTGCVSDGIQSEATYPEYNKWWAETPGPRRSANLSELGQGDILVFENGLEAVLL